MPRNPQGRRSPSGKLRQSHHKPGQTCPACQKVHTTRTGGNACVGHSRDGSGRACANPPKSGHDVCWTHGAGSPQAQAAAERRIATAAIQADTAALLASEGLDGVADPIAEIGRLATEALALKRAAGARVNALEEIRYTGGLQRDERGELVGTGTEQVRAEVVIYERALDRSMRFLEIVAKHAVPQDADRTKAMLAQLGEALGIEQTA
jgi:hypothetical protein